MGRQAPLARDEEEKLFLLSESRDAFGHEAVEATRIVFGQIEPEKKRMHKKKVYLKIIKN